MYYWKASSNDGAYEDRSEWHENKCFETKQDAYEDMRYTALMKMQWNTEYDEDFADGTEVIDYDVHFSFSQGKIIHESYSGIYTYEIYEQ